MSTAHADVCESILGENNNSVNEELGHGGDMVFIGHGLMRLQELASKTRGFGIDEPATVAPVDLLLLSLSQEQYVVPKLMSMEFDKTRIDVKINLQADIDTVKRTVRVDKDHLNSYLLLPNPEEFTWPPRGNNTSIRTCIAYLHDNKWKYDEVKVTERYGASGNGIGWSYRVDIPQPEESPTVIFTLSQD